MKRELTQSCDGFSLLEVLLVSLMISVVIGVIGMAFIDALQTSSVAGVRLQMQMDLRDTLGYMSRIIRFAGVRPVDTAIEEIDESYMVFQGDYDGDGATDRFSFSYDSVGKMITVTHWEKYLDDYYLVNNPEVVMNHVEELQFAYYTKDNVETLDPDEVTSITVRITILPPDSARKAVREMVGTLSASQRVYCPNLAWRLSS